MQVFRAIYTKKRLLSNDGVSSFFCIFGKNGVAKNKIEGDWKTPAGLFPVRKIYYRHDRIKKIKTDIECIPLSEKDIWCDDVNKDEYNTFTKLPFDGNYENLWREDELYDIIIVIGYNDNPTIKNKGSAIFIHVARKDMKYTKGCLALKKEDLIQLIKKMDSNSKIEILEK